MLDIVVPARGEATSLPDLFTTLLADAAGLRLCVVVALNGEEVGAMEAVIAAWTERFAAAGHRLLTTRSAPGKIAALNAGDALRSGGAVAYVDADARLAPGSLPALASALSDDAPRLAGLRIEASAPGWPAASFAAVWSALPGVTDFIGSGCYAVNRAGRARWGAFPAVVADDAFVFSRFAATERRIVAEGGIGVLLPTGWALARIVRRWRDGNRALAAAGWGDVRRGAGLRWLAGRPRLWTHLPGFLAVRLAARLVRSPANEGGWKPERPCAASTLAPLSAPR